MYRERIHMTVRDYDGWKTAIEITQELNAICTRLNVPTAVLWTETVGTFNQLTWEVDHPTLASYAGLARVAPGPGRAGDRCRGRTVARPGAGGGRLPARRRAAGTSGRDPKPARLTRSGDGAER